LKLPSGFETARLVLREAVASDAQAIFSEYAADPEVTRYLSFPTHTSRADADAFLDSVATLRQAGRANTYVLTRRGEEQLLGVFDLRIESPVRLTFGYALGRRHWGQGLMPEVLAAAVAWARDQPEVWRLWAFCDGANKASARTMEKAGLEFEGVLRRWFVYPNIGPEPRDSRAYAWVR